MADKGGKLGIGGRTPLLSLIIATNVAARFSVSVDDGAASFFERPMKEILVGI